MCASLRANLGEVEPKILQGVRPDELLELALLYMDGCKTADECRKAATVILLAVKEWRYEQLRGGLGIRAR